MRTVLAVTAVLIGGYLFAPVTFADGDCGSNFTTVQFMRDDLSNLKKSMEAALAAIPKPQAPYGKESDNWNLPTYTCKDKSGMRPIDVSYSSHYTTDASTKKLGEEYQKQILAAGAKGDYAAVAKITQEMQQKLLQQASANEQMAAIDIDVSANTGDSATIDPDSVLRDGAGFLAVRTDKDASSGTESVTMYFDPVALKNAHQLARFDMSGDFRVASKLALLSLKVRLDGPSKVLEGIVKNVDASKVLSTLTAERKNLRSNN